MGIYVDIDWINMICYGSIHLGAPTRNGPTNDNRNDPFFGADITPYLLILHQEILVSWLFYSCGWWNV